MIDVKKVLKKGLPEPTGIRTGMANPSATLAVERGLQYRIVTNPDGSQSGLVTLKSGKEVNAWDWYRKVQARKKSRLEERLRTDPKFRKQYERRLRRQREKNLGKKRIM